MKYFAALLLLVSAAGCFAKDVPCIEGNSPRMWTCSPNWWIAYRLDAPKAYTMWPLRFSTELAF